MEYYHGTRNENIIFFDNKREKKKSDLGVGIYTTTFLNQSKEWACKNSNQGVVYVSEIDLSKYPIKIVNYNGNADEFEDLFYLCRNNTEDIAEENITDYANADIIICPVLSNIKYLYRNIRKLHGANYSINKNKNKIKNIIIKEQSKNDSFEIVSKSIKFHNNMNQVFFKSDLAISIFNENLKKIIYYKKINNNIVEINKQKLVFSKEKNKIEKR